jgi:hypothetical protein
MLDPTVVTDRNITKIPERTVGTMLSGSWIASEVKNMINGENRDKAHIVLTSQKRQK